MAILPAHQAKQGAGPGSGPAVRHWYKNRRGADVPALPRPAWRTAPGTGAAPILTPRLLRNVPKARPYYSSGYPSLNNLIKRPLDVGPMPLAWRFCPRIRHNKGPGRAPVRLLCTGIKTDVGRLCLRCRAPPDARHPGRAPPLPA